MPEKRTKKSSQNKKKSYLIGVDGGGTKTVAALADFNGRILKMARAGPASPRNVRPEIAAENVAQAIKKVLRKGRVLSTFIGLAAVEEQPRLGWQFKKEILKRKKISQVLEGKVAIGSDQIVAFRAGTEEKDGVLIIAGTGCIVRGWRGDKEARAGAWGWLNDEGSAFWTGQKVFQAIFRDLDERGSKTMMTNLAFKELKAKNISEFLTRVYSERIMEIVPLFSIIADKASKKGDKVARKILKEAGEELALSTKMVIKKLGFGSKEFPLVLVGGMFKSKIVLATVKEEIKKIAPGAKFIRLRKEPVIGAVKLALENL